VPGSGVAAYVSFRNVGEAVSPTFLILTYAPEPGTLMLLGAGIAGLVAVGRRKLK